MDTRLYQIAHIPPEETALSNDISDSATSFSVEDASTLPSDPSTGDYYLYVKGEFMALDATDANNDTVNVTRGALGTSPREHKAGDVVYEGEIDADGVDDRELRRIDEIANPDIKDIGEIEQNLEYEKAKFRISNCKVTINGLPKDRLQDAGSVHRPWVFEIVDDTGTVVFSGIVDGESVSFTASSRNTSFDVLSWLELLDRAGSVPARDVFEVDVYGTARSNEDSAFVDSNQDDIQIKLNNEASLVGQVAQVGDVAVIETDESEIRKQIVRRETDDDDRVVIFINAKEEGDGTDVVRKVPGAGSYSTETTMVRIGQTGYSDLRVRITDDQQVFDIIEAVNGDLGSLPSGGSKTISVPEGFSVEVDLKYKAVALNRFNNVEATDERSATVHLDEIEVYGANDDYYIEFTKGFDDTINTGPRSDTPVDDVVDQEYRVRIKRDSTQRLAEDLSSDSTVRILGQEIYGYEGNTYFDQVLYYEGQPLIKNLFQIEAATTTGRAQLGVLPQVFDAASYDSLNDFARIASIDPRVELPDDPLKALRQIQQRRQFLLKERFSNRTNSNGEAIPGYYPEFIFRDGFFDSAVEVSERKVKEWTENVSENDLRAVIVKSNEEYLKGRAGPDVEERIGFYFEGISRYENADAEDIRDRMSPPEGRNVIEIEMPIIPSEEIGYKYRGGDTVENNPKLRYVAKFFYEHFTKASREVEITFGDDTPEWIGGYWYFKNQGDVIDDYVFVSQETKSVDSKSIDASLKGRIGQEAATIDDAPPTAVVKGPKEISRANSAGDVQVVLNGDESFSLSGNPLSFTWERKKVGGTFSEVQSNGSILKDTVSGVDREVGYVYRLTVTDDRTGVTDSVTHDLTVAPNRNEAAPTPQNQSFDVKTWQQNANDPSNESSGFLEVIPDQFNSLDKVEKRSEVGGNIDKGAAFSEVSRFQVDVASIDTTNDKIVLTGDYEEHFQKPFLYAKEDDAGGTTLFDISNATYDSGANETTISLAESIDSTRFDAVETGTFVMRVALSTKHTSAIEIRTTGAVDNTRQTQTHTFDFDNLAEVDASVYNDESGAVYADVRGDEDTDNFDLEYRKNGGTWQSDLTGQTNSIVGYEVLAGDQVSDGDQVEVRITPYNTDGEQGRQVVRATFYNRSQDGGAQFDAVTINGAGTIDSVNTGEFRFRDESGNDAAKIDVFNIELEQINSIPIGDYARTDQDETFTGDVTIQSNLYVQGTETITNTETLDIATNLGVLNAGETNAGVTKGYAGYEVDRGTLAPFRWIFDEGGDRFRIGQWYKTLSHGSVTNGPFQENERVFGQTSGAEAYIWRVGSGEIDVKRRTGSFDVAGGETIEGETSGATATLTARATTDDTQAVATREDNPETAGIPFWNNTDSTFKTTPDLYWRSSSELDKGLNLSSDIPLRGDSLWLISGSGSVVTVGSANSGDVVEVDAGAQSIATFSADDDDILDLDGDRTTERLRLSTTDASGIAYYLLHVGTNDNKGLIAYGENHPDLADAVSLYNFNAAPIHFWTDNTKQATLDGSGNFGFQKVDPKYAVDSAGPIRTTDDSGVAIGNIDLADAALAFSSFSSGLETATAYVDANIATEGWQVRFHDGKSNYREGIYVDPQQRFAVGHDSPEYTIDAAGKIGRNYLSGAFGSGYIIDPDNNGGRSHMEVDSLRVRGTLSAHIFEKEKVRAANGFVLFTSSTTLSDDVTTPGTVGSSNSFTFYVKDNVFTTGDLVWYKDIDQSAGLDVYSVQMTIDSIGASVTRNGQTVYPVTAWVNNGSGTDVTMKGGGTVVRTGNTTDAGRQGSVFIDTESTSAPFIDIYDGVSSWAEFQDASKLKARIGNLDGVSHNVLNPSGYGIYTENGYFDGEIVAQTGEIVGELVVGSTAYIGPDTIYDDHAFQTSEQSAWMGDNGPQPTMGVSTENHAAYFWADKDTSGGYTYVRARNQSANREFFAGLEAGNWTVRLKNNNGSILEAENDTVKFADWEATANQLTASAGENYIILTTQGGSYPSITLYNNSGTTSEQIRASMGEMWTGSWTGEVGFALHPTNGADPYVQFTRDISSGTLTAQIAGFDFDDQKMSWANTIYLGNQVPSVFDSGQKVSVGFIEDEGRPHVGVRGSDGSYAALYNDSETTTPYTYIRTEDGESDGYFRAGKWAGNWHLDLQDKNGSTLFQIGDNLGPFSDNQGNSYQARITNLLIEGNAAIKGDAIIQDELFANNATVSATLTIGDGSTGAVQSYNYDGSQGWQIKGDNATFENGSFRGNVEAESGSLSDLQVQGQLTFPSTYDTSQIRIGSGADAFFIGDFSFFGSGQGSDSPQIQDSVSANFPGTTQTSSTTDSYNDSAVGGASVTVDVDWDSSSTTSEDSIDRNIDPNTQVEVEIVVEELDAGSVTDTRTKTAGSINQSGTLTFSFTANSSTDEIRVTTNLTAQIGDDEEYYDSVTISNDDAFIDWTNEQDFVGPEGAIWRDDGNLRVQIDGGYSGGAKDDRIIVQEGRVTIRDSNGNDVISIQSNGLIVFHQKRNHPDQAAMDYGQGSIYAYDAGSGNVNLGWTEDSGYSDSAF
jgi:hypothetical protein